MREREIKFCLQCGAEGVATREISPTHVTQLYCPQCGVMAEVLWEGHPLIGASAAHDPDGDSEPW